MKSVSANYRELHVSEVEAVAAELAKAWQDPAIPARQYVLIVKSELELFRAGSIQEPYAAFLRCIRRLPAMMNRNGTTFLDAGASGGYYSEILRRSGFQYDYVGMDFSPAFRELALRLYPGIVFDIGDARQLPYPTSSFDIVLSSAVMMHNLEYEHVLAEAARVSKQYVLLHRTPVETERRTRYWIKEAYGVPCLEIHFNESELFNLFAKYGLSVIWQDDVFFDGSFGHRDYLLQKDPVFHVAA